MEDPLKLGLEQRRPSGPFLSPGGKGRMQRNRKMQLAWAVTSGGAVTVIPGGFQSVGTLLGEALLNFVFVVSVGYLSILLLCSRKVCQLI